MEISEKEYKRNCEYEKDLEKIQKECEHPMGKRLWYKHEGNLIIACERCGYNDVLEVIK